MQPIGRLSFVATLVAVSIAMSTSMTALPAEASCNSVPDALQISGGTGPGKNLREELPKDLPYPGDFGRIDRAVLVPGVTEGVVVGPDLGCGERLLLNKDGGPEASRDDVIGIVLFRNPVTGPEFAIYATPEVRGRIQAVFKTHGRGDGPSAPVNWQTDKLEVRQGLGPLKRETYRVRFSYPEASSARDREKNERRMLSGPMTVALVGATESGIENIAALEQKLLARGCESVREGFEEEHDGYICVGTIYDEFVQQLSQPTVKRAVSSRPQRCNSVVRVQDTIPCEIIALSAKELDFGKQCFPQKPGSTLLPVCQNSPETMEFDVGSCGGVHIPISWTDIMVADKNKRRIVFGRSGVARERYPKNSKRIVIPGREFVGSTHPMDVNGKVGDWRRPDIEVIYPGNNQLVGLKGSVDTEQSVVHIYPRLATAHHCEFKDLMVPGSSKYTEACLGVQQMQEGGVEKCACADRPDSLCKCLVLGPPKYYACSAGALKGMPCTRPLHCSIAKNPGHCSGQPTCRRIGEVWEKGKTHSQTFLGNKPCHTDAECKGSKDNAGHSTPQCGYSLFEFRSPPKYAPEVRTLDFGLSYNAGISPQRGTCANNHENACQKKMFSFKCSWLGTGCVGYLLHAGGTK